MTQVHHLKTKIEDVSNEVLYEIFDYLDGSEILLAFSNVNHRFEQLLYSSSFLFKLQFRETKDQQLISKYKAMIRDYKQKIISFHLYSSSRNNSFFSLFFIDSSFDRLELLSLIAVHPNTLLSCLVQLGRLPRLYSLIVVTWNDFDDLQAIYRSIFALPSLKLFKLTISEDNSRIYRISLPMANLNELSTIQYLEIVHSCPIYELERIVSYTPKLRHLKFLNNDDYYPEMGNILLLNLKHLSISANHLHFDEFEIFIKTTHYMLKVLHLTVQSEYKDASYLDAVRWERLIVENLPQLKEFELEYYQYASDEQQTMKYKGKDNRFTSPFWLQRRWIYELKIDDEKFIYSVHPYKKRWYEHLQPRIDHSSPQSFESGQIIVKGNIFTDNVNSLSTTTDSTLILTQFYHLVIDMETVSGEELVEVLHDLPNIISLKLHRVTPFQQFDSSEEDDDNDDDDDEEQKCFIQVSETNKITEIYLEQMNDFIELDFLLGLCRHVKHLQINSLQTINIESFIRQILVRITGDSNHYLCLLCLRIPTADDQLIEKLQKIIDADVRLVNCTIKRILDKIYFPWG